MKPVTWNRIKEGELVGMTLIELLLVFIFAFLLVLNIYYRQSEELKANIEEVQLVVASISDNLPADDLGERHDSPADIVRTLDDLEKIERAINELAEADAFLEPDLWRVVSNKGGLANVIAALDELRDKLDMQETQNSAMSAALKDAGIEAPDVGTGSLGDRPGNCWYSDPILKRGDQYLLRVTIFEEDIEVEPAWPDERANDVRQLQIEDLLERIPGEMAGTEFMQLTRSVFEKSKRDNCRYYVRINDQTTTKLGFQERMREVESHFYKLPENF